MLDYLDFAAHPGLRLATGVTLLPHHDPVRLAEDFATLDVVSDGRAELWVGRGVEPTVYRQFGLPGTVPELGVCEAVRANHGR